MSSKAVFISGAASTAVNVHELAEKVGLFSTPALTVFTIVIGFIFCLLGGITFVSVWKWFGRKSEKVIERYDKWMLK